MKSILDKDFRYTPSVETDIRKTFARVKREQAKVKAQEQQEKAKAKVVSLNRRNDGG